MLTYQLLKNHAGILLIGDYLSLRELYEVVLEVNEASPIIVDKDEGVFLSLAYDVRKAYEQQRKIIAPPEHSPEIGTRFGSQILWPVLLPLQRQLRESLSYFPATRMQQALTYLLEDVIERALKEDFGAAADPIIREWLRMQSTNPELDEKIQTRGGLFCSWTRKERRDHLATLLMSFDPGYELVHEIRMKQGEQLYPSPAELRQWKGAEWPNPRA